MSDYDDIIDEVEVFANAEKARRHQRAVRVRMVMIIALVAALGVGAALYVSMNAFRRRAVAGQVAPPCENSLAKFVIIDRAATS